MPKKDDPRPSQSNRRLSRSFLRRYWPLTTLVLLIALSLLVVYGLHVYHDRAIRDDKARFTQAEKDVDSLSRQIADATGPPLKTTTIRFCSKPSLKFENGPLSCNIDADSYYAVQNELDATTIFQQVSPIAQNKWHRTHVQSSNSLADSHQFGVLNMNDYVYNRDYRQIFEDYNSKNVNMNCKITYSFYKASEPPFTGLLRSDSIPAILAVSLSCGDHAKAQYFPMDH